MTERTMVTHFGISSSLHPDHVDETIVRKAKMVYIDLYTHSHAAPHSFIDHVIKAIVGSFVLSS